MADRAKSKRRRVEPPSRLGGSAAAPSPTKLKLATPLPKYLTRMCRLRLPGTDRWLSVTLAALSGADKQTCELDLTEAAAEAVGGSSAASRKMKIKLATQPLHVADEVVWGPEDGDGDSTAVVTAQGGTEGRGGLAGGFVEGLVPMTVFANLGPPELEAEDGHVLAHSLKSGKHVWIRRETTRPLLAQMLRRRTPTALKKATDAALEADKAIKLLEAKSKKKSAVGKRLAVYWPMDDAWYTGIVRSWDAKAAQHQVLYDDGIEEAIALHEEAHHFFASAADEMAYREFSMCGPCLHCKKPGWLLSDVVGGEPLVCEDVSAPPPPAAAAPAPSSSTSPPSTEPPADGADAAPPAKRAKADTSDAHDGAGDAPMPLANVGGPSAAAPAKLPDPAAAELIFCARLSTATSPQPRLPSITSPPRLPDRIPTRLLNRLRDRLPTRLPNRLPARRLASPSSHHRHQVRGRRVGAGQ